MNVYFFSDADYIMKQSSILYNILKIKKIINFVFKDAPYHKDDFQIDNSMLLYDAELDVDTLYKNPNETYEDVLKKKIMQAVYKFNMPVCQPNGKGGFIINDKYKNSNAHNPIYNLEYCDDDNVLVLCDMYLYESISSFFTKYSINILKKYAPELHYENKICFIRSREDNELDFQRYSHVYYYDDFKSLVRFIPHKKDNRINLELGRSYSLFKLPRQIYDRKHLKEIGIFYDPLISYLTIKLKELYSTEIEGKDILFFLFGADFFNSAFIASVNDFEEYERANIRCFDYDADTSWADSELEYIMNNGGDWINY